MFQKGIEDLAQHYSRREGVLAIEKVTRGDLDALASSMGGSIVSDLDDFRADDVCDGEVTVRKVGDHPLVFFLAHTDSAKRHLHHPRARFNLSGCGRGSSVP